MNDNNSAVVLSGESTLGSDVHHTLMVPLEDERERSERLLREATEQQQRETEATEAHYRELAEQAAAQYQRDLAHQEQLNHQAHLAAKRAAENFEAERQAMIYRQQKQEQMKNKMFQLPFFKNQF